MARVRSVDFLPEIFQTPTNRQFLSATLDQLIQEPKFQKTQGFVGRKIGNGVNPQDRYVIEPTQQRNNYQLEPGVIGVDSNTQQIEDVITYPGINDALALQGAFVNNADRLYRSEYYSWDPFVDFDKFVNYQQYYWLPGGPSSVTVSATQVPLTNNFIVSRNNGVYTFSGVAGTNPTLTLVRNGNYTFEVAQNQKEEINFRVGNSGGNAYVIDYQNNPVLTLVRGNTYVFTFVMNAPYSFWIKTQASLGTTNAYNSGVTNNGTATGTLTFVVPQDAPDTLFYASATQVNMRGQINIVDAISGTGPGFWIQTDPGVDGRIPYTPNISSRDVLGVSNNGEDLGTVAFNVPPSTAQDFFYNLVTLNPVDLVTNLRYDQIQDQPVETFIATRGGIDSITDLNNRTLIFELNSAGWGTIPLNQRYNIWRIQYYNVGLIEYISLVPFISVNDLQKFSIAYGTQWSSTQWYKNADGYFETVPLMTAVKDVLYYQDGTDPDMFGQIQLIDPVDQSVLYVEDILDKKNYVSPNGVVFTNGLKVTFRGQVVPESYADQTYYVEGVGTAIQLLPIGNFVTPEPYTQSATVPYDTTPYDIGNYDEILNEPFIPDYLTINRASPDLSAWSRSNRWFHVDVIRASAAYNNTEPLLDNAFRGRRPILEFRAGIKLLNFGTQGKQPVNIIDFEETDALSNINGTSGYGIDGYEFINGTRVIFAADVDPAVRNRVYVVNFITPDSENPLIDQPIINLVPAVDAEPLFDQTVVCLSGLTLQGQSFWFDGITWFRSQQKTQANQAPLFDLYDSNGISFSNREIYPSNTFTGNKLFSYAPGLGTKDPILGFALKYLSLANIGDIVFDNNLYTDTFVYVKNSVSFVQNTSAGFVRQYSDRVIFDREIGWQTAATASQSRQQFSFVYNGKPLKLDVAASPDRIVPSVQLFVNSEFQDPNTYLVSTTDNSTMITLLKVFEPDSAIEVAVLSDQVSTQGFYQVPVNLSNNPFNANSATFTLGTVRGHYISIAENLLGLAGPINGANNTRDLGNIVPYGQQILQQSASLTLAGYFSRNTQYDIYASLTYNSREYIKYKNLLLETVVRNDYGDLPVSKILDNAIFEITQGRTSINPFYWSDMLPSSQVYTENNYTITPITLNTFDTVQTYTFTSANYLGLLVYLTRTTGSDSVTTLLDRGIDYEVSTTGPTLTVLLNLQLGDVISIQEYNNTVGNFCPNTPTKMGLYPKFLPSIYFDSNYVNPTFVIQGHDGSTTVAFGDIRDQVLLEFEKRIYNNLKTDDNPVPLTYDDVAPGYFRKTDYSQTEITKILGESFLSWVGWNKIDYKTQDYIANNAFTYNYSSAGSKLGANNQVDNLTETPLLGAWRGIYKFFYDTITPNTTPWEMLGFTEQPTWWEDRYGPAPYTRNNLVLWDDLEAGLVADPISPYVIPKYRRPGLTSVIPVGDEGELLPPLQSVVGDYDSTAFVKSWNVGDGGPVEASWWNSSDYPFVVMRLLLLTRPAEFFNLFVDRDLYRYNDELGQFLYKGRYRYDASATNPDSSFAIEIYGNGVSKASYINWIIDYNQQLGRNSTTNLTKDLTNLDVRLCWRMASFTDKQYLRIFTEKSSPNSQNSSLLLPDESYNLLVYKNQPFAEIVYSALIIERVEQGYAVFGYSNTEPYFEILASSSAGTLQTVSAGGTSVRVPAQYTDFAVQVPYGYVFTNTTMVVDFILSYGAWLQLQGLEFNDVENGYQLDWNQMAQEFLYFSQQGWSAGTLINLNPASTKLTAVKENAVVDSIESLTPENMLLNQNRDVLPTRDLIIDRNGNSFTVTSLSGQTISYLRLKFTNYENMVVLDNVSIFADLIYDPTTGARQDRVRITAATTVEWNGVVDAQGFILNQNNVREWEGFRKYTKGEIVLYKNTYWAAQTIVQPKNLFDYNDWVKADYQLIQEGLLPNIANKADQLTNSYNINSANLERDNDLLSYGLIGFRPREYMTALNLDDVSQVNIYQQFLGNKGTIRAAELFTRADFGKESGAYKIYENWGILTGTYGANANRSFFELRLFENLLQSDPNLVQVVLPQQTSTADQTILVENIWRSSYNITTPEILPTSFKSIKDTALPSAGYVNLEDVDITVFSLDDPASIAASIETIGIGTLIWVAKSNSYDWDIYRCEKVPGRLTQITDNLNNTSAAYFTTAHNLAVGDLVVVRYFNESVNGVYRVLSVPSITSVIISYSFVNTNQTTLSGDGLVFFLQSARVAQASDVGSLPYVNQLVPGARAWVDNNGFGQWVVLEKQNPFSQFFRLESQPRSSNSFFSTSLAQSSNNFAALVGAPGFNNGAGSVVTYLTNINGQYEININLELAAPEVAGFGNAVDFGDKLWSVAAASASRNGMGYVAMLYLVPASNNYEFTQLLVPPDLNFAPIGFGTDVVITPDERWLYVGAPGANTVYAYNRYDIQTQSVGYVTDGIQTQFNYSDHMTIDSNQPDQLIVSLNNLQGGVFVEFQSTRDYTIDANNVILENIPPAGFRLVITRKQLTQLDNTTYFDVTQNSTSGLGTGVVFTVSVGRGTYFPTLVSGGSNYAIGDTITINGSQLGGVTPADNLEITVSSINANNNNAVTNFTFTGSGKDDEDVFLLQNFLYTATNIYSFIVEVDQEIQRPWIDYEFDDLTRVLTFLTLPPPAASIIVTAGTYWKYVDSITVSGIPALAQFGCSLSTSTDGRQIAIGSKSDNVVNAQGQSINRAGSVYVFDRSVVRYLINDASQLTYAIPGTFVEPVSVILNNEFLTNSAEYLDGQFSVVGSDIVLNNSISLMVGDILEIETNQFKQIQKIIANDATDESEFGAATVLCSTNCSLYTGSPLDTVTNPQQGSVQRSINQSRLYGVITSTVANPSLVAGNTLRINNQLVTVPANPNNNIESLVQAINTSGIPNVVATLTPNLEYFGNGSQQTFDVGDLYSVASSYTVKVLLDNILQIEGVNYSYNAVTKQINFVIAPVLNAQIVIVSGRMTLNVINTLAAFEGNRLTVLPGVNGNAFNAIGWETFVYAQTILSPLPTDYAYFGASLDVNSNAINLIVGAPNADTYMPVTFDNGTTIFDDRSTTFFTLYVRSGNTYTFDFLPSANSSVNNPGVMAFGQQVFDTLSRPQDRFGVAVNFRQGRLLIGAPGNDAGVDNGNFGLVSVYNNTDNRPAWAVIRQEKPTVNIDQINSVFMYDRLTNQTETFFDFFDPLQGKILGAARRNIDYIGAVDPAFYNVGPIHNNGNSWANEHVGDVWWDTDTVRFIDPNQDDITYASRRWGQVFPGSRVDIYQWTSSDVTPLNYTGPGIPFSPESYTVNTTLNQENIFETKYYFWVRGLTTVSDQGKKTLSPVSVARYIENPRSTGIAYIAPLNASTIAIYNAFGLISAQDTIIHIEFDKKPTEANVHQEYGLIADGRADSFLNASLYLKLIDSFCGAGLTGANVPDPSLSPPERYGVQFRPRQSMFLNRFSALKNYLERANTVFVQYPIVETKNLSLLNSNEPEPPQGPNTWDRRLANLEELSFQDLFIVPLGYRYLIDSDGTENGLWAIYEVQNGPISGTRVTVLIRVQSYDTRLYWSEIDWYRPGYNSTINPIAEVPVYSELQTLTLKQAPIGSSVKVTANNIGKFEIYIRTTERDWERVGLENGTLQINEEIWNYSVGNFGFDVEVFDAQLFDQEPTIETRKIIQAINQELFVDDLLIERNRSLILMFNFIYSEFAAPEWLIKTSLIDVDHTIRALKPYQNYLQDNQTFVLDYIQEVKPYHVQVREFNLAYDGNDIYPGEITDFDVPAYYNRNLEIPKFVSPVLLPYLLSNSLVENYDSDTPSNAQIWLERPWDQWFNNYQLTLEQININRTGQGYNVAPEIVMGTEWQAETAYALGQQIFYEFNLYTVTQAGTTGLVPPTFTSLFNTDGTTILTYAGTRALATAVVNSAGRLTAINITDSGFGYTTTPMVNIVGGNGIGAQASAVMNNGLIRSIKTVIKYDRYQYQTTITEWQPNVIYPNGTQVRYIDLVWSANTPNQDVTTGPEFDFANWQQVDPATLSGVDRTMGLYVPTVNQPGLSLPLLIDGVDYPGVQVLGPTFGQNTGYDIGNYDMNPYDNIDYGPEGRPTYDPGILDAIYTTQYLDIYLGIAPAPAYNGNPPNQSNAVVANGGAYIDTYSSHAPEELIPGSEFDTLDLRVYTRSGSDWPEAGHGFPIQNIKYEFTAPFLSSQTFSWNGLQPYPSQIVVYNQTTGSGLNKDVNYTVDYVNQTVTVTSGATAGNILVISVYSLGGGNQLFESLYNESIVGSSVIIPVQFNEIFELAIFVDGENYTDFSFAPSYELPGVQTVYVPTGSSGTTLVVDNTLDISVGSLIVGTGFSSGQTVVGKLNLTTLLISATPNTTPSGILTFRANNGSTLVEFNAPLAAGAEISLTAIGPTTVNDSSIDYSWSLPQTQLFVADGIATTFTLNNSMDYNNPVNSVITVNGVRARTAGGVEYISDGSTVVYDLPTRLGFSQVLISDNEVEVYQNNIPLTLNLDYSVDPFVPGIDRTVTLSFTPEPLDEIQVYVTTNAQAYIVGDQLIFAPGMGLIPILGDIISVTSWNDTRQQNLLTQVYVGPVTEIQPVYQGYDKTDYDIGTVSGLPGSFSYESTGGVVLNNLFLNYPTANPDRLWITLNGRRLFNGVGFTLNGNEIVLSSGTLGSNDVVMITESTDSTVPEAMAFRIFQDMRGLQLTYRITPNTTTVLTQNLGQLDDIIYVEDASRLANPNLNDNIWGVVTIDGERIMYRNRNTVANTVSSLMRGTAGTGAAEHLTGAAVYDMGRENLLSENYQNYVVSDTIMTNGTQTVFSAPNVSTEFTDDSTLTSDTVEVYVAGQRQQADYVITQVAPVIVEFDVAPPAGVEVTILVRRGVTWYAPGPNTPSNGIALQETNTPAARFLRGLA
jgi:hypothetical protein